MGIAQRFISRFADLDDVALAGLADQDVLQYDAASGKIKNAPGGTLAAVGAPFALGSVKHAKLSGYPTFAKYAGNPIFLQSQSSKSTILHPCVLKASDYLAAPIDEYYMWYSTDHDPVGYISLATAPSPLGPWTDHGVVWNDATAGQQQTEIPSVWWDYANGFFRMAYLSDQTSSSIFTVKQAHSADGVTWTGDGITIQQPYDGSGPGAGNFGYLRVFRHGGGYVGFTLSGGGNYTGWNIVRSLDGVNWIIDPNRIGPKREWFSDGDTQFSWIGIGLFEYRGEIWALGSVGTPTSGPTSIDKLWYVGPVTDDLRSFKRQPIDVTPAHQAWEASVTGDLGCLLYDDGNLYAYYRGNGNTGGFGVALLELA